MSINLRGLEARIEQAAQHGGQRAAEHILEKAQDDTPVDTGDLKRSGRVRRTGSKTAITFHDPVAIIVHENMTAEHKRGNAKFLENALNSERDEALKIIADEIRRAMGA